MTQRLGEATAVLIAKLTKERDAWRDAAHAQRSLAACLRTGRPPTNKVYAALDRTRAIWESDSGCEPVNGGSQ